MTDVPFFLETRVRQALTRVHEVARRKGLSDAFDVDLFAVDRAVQDLLGAPATADDPAKPGAGTPEGARVAQSMIAKLDELLGRLEAAHDRGPQGAEAPVGRAGRRASSHR